MELADYLERIEYAGRVEPSLDCLNAIHRQHLLHIPYENLDVQMRRPVDFDLERIFEKIVKQRRGGWCYEMNGLLAWALGQVGFEVTRMTGAVTRRDRGDETLGNHLVLSVDLDGPHVADVGLGNGLIEPIPLREGRYEQEGRTFRLERLEEPGFWRFHNTPGVFPPDFDFVFAPADERVLATACDQLQSDPESMFRQNLVCQRLRPSGVLMLLGRVVLDFSESSAGPTKRTLDSAEDLAETLARDFGLKGIDVSALWPAVVARHAELGLS